MRPGHSDPITPNTLKLSQQHGQPCCTVRGSSTSPLAVSCAALSRDPSASTVPNTPSTLSRVCQESECPAAWKQGQRRGSAEPFARALPRGTRAHSRARSSHYPSRPVGNIMAQLPQEQGTLGTSPCRFFRRCLRGMRGAPLTGPIHPTRLHAQGNRQDGPSCCCTRATRGRVRPLSPSRSCVTRA